MSALYLFDCLYEYIYTCSCDFCYVIPVLLSLSIWLPVCMFISQVWQRIFPSSCSFVCLFVCPTMSQPIHVFNYLMTYCLPLSTYLHLIYLWICQVFVDLFTYLSVFVYLPVCLVFCVCVSVYLFFYLLHLFVCWFTCLSLCLSGFLCICVCLSFYLPSYLFLACLSMAIYLSVCLAFCLSGVTFPSAYLSI